MNKMIYIMILLLPLALRAGNQPRHHLELDLSTQEYDALLKQFLSAKGNGLETMEPESQMAISGGQKFSQWLVKINQARRSDDQIRLTSANTRRGIPIDSPSIYGPKQIKERLEELLQTLPSAMKEVAYGNSAISSTLPLEKELFIEWGRKIDKLYQTAVRWTTSVKPWLSYYKQRKKDDVRGYYYLSKYPNLDQILNDYNNLSDQEKTKLEEYLIGICQNSGTEVQNCQGRFDNAVAKNSLLSFKNSFWSTSKETWDSFFKIDNPRRDIDWTSAHADTLEVPFKDPNNSRIANFLKENIEDEFKWKNWGLQLNMVSGGFGTAHLEFSPNVTPHVTGGNTIVMDANTPIEEYEVQWTIRHEYGHILRFPDCYVEFYDEAIESVVNYQLDVNDLMCSRAGNMNQRIYDELKLVYFKK